MARRLSLFSGLHRRSPNGQAGAGRRSGATASRQRDHSRHGQATRRLPIAAPGTEIYTAKRGEAIPTIARRYLGRTSYLTSSELADAIRAVNHNGDRTANILKANENIVIPGILSAPVTEKTIPVPKDFEVRAIYLTGIMAGSDHGLRIIRHWREVGGNAVVFDIKDSDGSVTIPFEHPLLGKHNVYLHDVPEVRALPAPAEHARHRPHRHLPRRAPGQGASRTRRPVPQEPNGLARKRQAGLDRSLRSPKSRTTTSPWPST